MSRRSTHVSSARSAIWLIVFAGLMASPAAGEQIVIDQVLAIPIPRATTRSLLAVDPLEMMLVNDNWTTPAAGDSVLIGADQHANWQSLDADKNGWFEGEILTGGYASVVVTTDQEQTWLLTGQGCTMVFVNGVPRIGSKYAYSDSYESWEPRFDYCSLPVHLPAGENHLLARCSRGRLKLTLNEPAAAVSFNTRDLTIPDLLCNRPVATHGALVIINAEDQPLSDLTIVVAGNEWVTGTTAVPIIQPQSVRKVGFSLSGQAPPEPEPLPVTLDLYRSASQDELLASATVTLGVRDPFQTHKRTFISEIDGSVQYYAVNPARSTDPELKPALILSVHGARVEAINQANSYSGKSWAHIVAATNRRPYGYDWEDWGRLDALEVLTDAALKLSYDPEHVYLTGHSMGGHGTWHLGATFPDRFAAIGPSAGWISFASYAPRQQTVKQAGCRELIQRALLPGDTLALSRNYRHHGIYILHGDADNSVPVEQARQMVEHLADFHHDHIYHEESEVGHWWDLSDEPGADCVDWAPMFDFFKTRTLPGQRRLRQVDFVTANPGVSARCHWLSIDAQIHPLQLSSVDIRHDPGRHRFFGTTANVARLSLEAPTAATGDTVFLELDQQSLAVHMAPGQSRIWLANDSETWQTCPPPAATDKNPRRCGTFKDAFRHRVLFVYGTNGTPAENAWAFTKARFDAECFWYQGNGSVDIVADRNFDRDAEPDRSIILFGNAETNTAWKELLADSPVQVRRGSVQIGDRTFTGNDLACLCIRPRAQSDIASVGIISGTGISGMRLTGTRPYLYAGYALPDLVVFTSDDEPGWIEAEDHPNGDKQCSQSNILAAGYFGNDWQIPSGVFAFE